MKDITIIVPIHEFNNDILQLTKNSLQSVVDNRNTYKSGKLSVLIITKQDLVEKISPIAKEVLTNDYDIVVNAGDTDFCSQVNFGAENVKTDFFSILEFDDLYKKNWFEMASKYYFSKQDVSVFLPINIAIFANHTQYTNEIAWAGSFSKEIGYIDFESLEDYTAFNLTGGIFNTQDFKAVGGFNKDIKVAFNYELLYNYTSKHLKVFVVPKEGYVHIIGRENSLANIYGSTLSSNEIAEAFEDVKKSYADKKPKKQEEE